METKLKYGEFIDKMTSNSFSVAMKDNRVGREKLRSDITEPKFFRDISYLEGIDIF